MSNCEACRGPPSKPVKCTPSNSGPSPGPLHPVKCSHSLRPPQIAHTHAHTQSPHTHSHSLTSLVSLHLASSLCRTRLSAAVRGNDHHLYHYKILEGPPSNAVKCRQIPRPARALCQSREGPSKWRAVAGPYPHTMSIFKHSSPDA